MRNYFKIDISQEDLVNYDYDEKVKFGEILRDIAKLTNSVIRVENDRKVYLHTRETDPTITIEGLIDLDSEVVNKVEKTLHETMH